MIKEIVTESRREYYYTRLYIDRELFTQQRKQSALIWGALGMLIALVLMMVGDMGILGIFLGLFVMLASGYFGYKNKYKELIDLANQQDARIGLIFPEFLQVFIGMLEVNPNGGIVNALKLSIPYTKNPVKSRVIRLVYDISADGSTDNVRRSLQDFGQYVGSIDAIRILDVVYTMYYDGVDTRSLDMASEKVEELNKNTVNTYVESKKKKLNMKSLPAIVLGVAFVFVFVGIVAIQYFTGAMAL